MKQERKGFTKEQVAELARNPNTARVSERTISFTAEMKEKVWELVQQGVSTREAVKSMGYDPDVLGVRRLQGLREMIRNDVREGREFHSGRRPKKTEAPDDEQATPDGKTELEMLRDRLAYVEEKLDFLADLYRKGMRREQ